MTTTDTRFIEAAERQMPTLWANHEATVREYLHHAGGGLMTLQRTIDETTGAHIVLSEDDALYLAVYSDDGEQCEGHEINVTQSDFSAVELFLSTASADPCPCVGESA